MTLKYWLVLSSVGAVAGLSIACSSKLDTCQARRTCAPGAASGGASSGPDGDSAGDAGSADHGGAGRGTGDSGSGGVTADGEAGHSGEGAGSGEEPALFGACSVKGAIVCMDHGTAQRLACDGQVWQAGPTCGANELCDSSSGKCASTVPECASAAPGATVCRGDTILTCGPDRVTASEGERCAGVCKLGVCQSPSCGDEKVEAGEECDNMADLASGACLKCKTAKCGDGAVYAGHEQCDDGNLVSGDGCSATCRAEPVELAVGRDITCARSSTGLVKCWGYNGRGALGLGDNTNRGDSMNTVPSKLPAIDLGTGRKATAISARGGSVCALLDNRDLKCWGNNWLGQLGTGDKNIVGDDPEEMGDKLKPVLLGSSKAIAVSAGDTHTCVVLDGDGGQAKCWGAEEYGQLGQDRPGELISPKDLPAIKLARPAVAISASNYISASKVAESGGASCALLDTGTVQCWGERDFVPHSSTTDLDSSAGIGDYAGEMSGVPVLGFGTGRVAKSIVAGNVSAAVLDDGSLRLWGTGSQLGQPNLGSNNIGLVPAELASLPAVQIGSGKKVKSISVSKSFACAVFDDGMLKCWGFGSSGELGLGATLSTTDAPSSVPSVNLGGVAARQVGTGFDHTCAILADGKLKCWGNNSNGELGLGDTNNRGDVGDKLGDDTTVDLTF